MITFAVGSSVNNNKLSSGGAKMAYNLFSNLKKSNKKTCIIFRSKGKLEDSYVYDLGHSKIFILRFINFILSRFPHFFKSHVRYYIQERLFDYFLYINIPVETKVLVTYSVVPFTAKRLKKRGVKIYMLAGNANDNLNYDIVKNEKFKYSIKEKDPYDYIPRLNKYNSFIKIVDKIVCCNEYIYSSFDNYIDKSKRILIPTIFEADYEMFNIDKKEVDAFNIFYIGHTVILKGVHNLVDSFNMFKANKNNVYLYVGGNIHPGVWDILSRKDLSNIIFLGYISTIQYAEQLSKSTLFIVPSLTDAGPVTMLEAMYTRTPVICSDGVGNRWVIRDGYNGFVYRKDSIIELTDILNYIYANKSLINEMGTNAKNTILENIDKKEIFYHKLQNELIK